MRYRGSGSMEVISWPETQCFSTRISHNGGGGGQGRNVVERSKNVLTLNIWT